MRDGHSLDTIYGVLSGDAAMKTVPMVSGARPFIGHALSFSRNPVQFLQRAKSLHGDTFRFRLLGKTVYALMSSKGNEAVFRAPDDVLDFRDAYRFTVPIFGKGVAYDVAPDLMDQQLRLIHPALRDEMMQTYANIMAEEVERFASQLGEQGEIDLLTAFNELTIFIAGRCLIGDEFRNRLSTDFAALYRDLESGLNLVAFVAPHIPTRKNRRRDRAHRKVVAMITDLIADRRRNTSQKADFLSVLMDARYADGSVLPDEVIAGLLLTLLFAGQHTSAVMATWLGVMLLKHPDYATAVAREASEIFKGGIRVATLKRMRLMECCLKETERLHPPLIMLIRKAVRPFEVDGVVIPPENLVMVSPAVTHRQRDVFINPDVFDPARFAPPREEDRKTPYSLVGFGGGKHRCIGMAFAHQQIKVIWGLLLQRFEFSLVDQSIEPDYATFVVGPRHPCRVRYRRRQPMAFAEAS
jgi:sterol 14-demethylase